MQTTLLKKPIGILGGTFDPIHHGHLRMAIELYESLNLEKIHLIPCYQPVHRRSPYATPEQRLDMIKCAIANTPPLLADDREIKRETPSYTIDTLLSLRHDYPNTPLCLLVGIDAFLDFMHWRRYTEILELAHVIIAHRPEYQLPASGALADMIQQRLQHSPDFIHQQLSGGILLRSITALEIAATEIRKLIAIGRNPRYLLPDSVYNYIKQNGVYL